MRSQVMWALLAWPLLVASCGGDDEALYCDRLGSCQAGNDQDERACRARLSGDREVNQIYGCTAAFQALLSCGIEKGQCQGGTFRDLDVCAAEVSALARCQAAVVEQGP